VNSKFYNKHHDAMDMVMPCLEGFYRNRRFREIIRWDTTIDGGFILCFDDTTSMLLISMDMVWMVGRKNCSHE